MKASLLARPGTVLLLAAALACGPSVAGFAATTATGAEQPDNGTAQINGMPNAATNTMPDSGTNRTPNATTSTMPNATTNGTAPGATATAPGAANATPESLEQMANQRIEDLHSSLQITAKQQPEWNKFAHVMRENAKQLDQAYQQRAQQFDTMNAVENIHSYAKIEQMRARDVEKLVPPFRSLYASLTPQQKQEADTLFRDRAQAAEQRHQSGATANR
jgi:protein CpxP